MNILYIILKQVIWRFQIYHLFREIFKFREDKSNNVFREIRKCFRKTAKLEIFRETNYMFGISRSPASKWYIICSCSKSLKSDYFAKIAHKIAEPKYFPNIFDDSDSPINSLSDDI